MRYYKKTDEARHEWGGEATYWLEVNDDGDAERQIEFYPNGHVISYDRSHLEDD